MADRLLDARLATPSGLPAHLLAADAASSGATVLSIATVDL